MTADVFPLPGETGTGRHRAARLWPEGVTPQRLAAHWRHDHHTPLPHSHHADQL